MTIYIPFILFWSNRIWSNLKQERQTRATRVWHEQHECDTSATRAARVRHECDTSNTNVTPVQHEHYEYDTSETRATRVQHKCDTSATRTTRVWHEWKTLILITTPVKTYFHTSTFTTWQVKDYKERSNFILRTTFWKHLRSMPKMHLKIARQKLSFLMAKGISKSYTLDCRCHLMLMHVPA